MVYDKKEPATIDNCPQLTATIENISFGTLWTPLYKSSQFTSTAHFEGGGDIIEYNNKQRLSALYEINGTVTVNGSITITGICSYRTARQIVIDEVIKLVYNEVKAKAKNL